MLERLPLKPAAWRQLAERLLSSRLLRRTGLLMGGSVLGQGLLVVSSPLLTRFYTPAEFGLFGLFFALITVLGLIACWRYETAILVVEEDGVPAVVSLCCLLGLLSGLVCLAVVLTAGERLAVLGRAPGLAPLLVWLPLGLVAFGLHWPLTNLAIRRQLYRPLAWNRFLQPAAQVLIQLALAGFGFGAAGLAIGQVLGVWVAVLQMLARLPALERRAVLAPRRRHLLDLAWRYRRSPFLSTPSTLLNNAHRQAPLIVLNLLYGPAASGWFYLAQRTLGAPMQFVGIAVQQTYLGEAARLKGKSAKALERLFVRTSALLFLPSLGLGLILAVAGPWIFALVFGQRWIESGHMAQLMAPLLIARFVVNPVSGTLYLLERESWQLLWDAVAAVALGLSFACAYWLGLGIAACVAIFSVTSSLIYAGRFLALWRFLRERRRAEAQAAGS